MSKVRQISTCRRSGSCRRRGVSLIEALIAILILWIAVLGISYTVTAGHQHMQHTEVGMRSMQLAEDLMQEIMAKSYAESGISVLGADAGETTRAAFDDVDDYHNHTEAAGELFNCFGEAYDTDAGLRRQVTVTLASQTLSPISITVPCKVVTVKVIESNGAVWQLIRYVAEPGS